MCITSAPGGDETQDQDARFAIRLVVAKAYFTAPVSDQRFGLQSTSSPYTNATYGRDVVLS